MGLNTGAAIFHVYELGQVFSDSSIKWEENSTVNLKKGAKCESCKLGFIWGKLKTIVQETAPQIPLRNCSKEVGEGPYIWDFGERRVHALKHFFFFFFYRFLLVTRSSHHHEGFWCFSRYEEIQELGSWNQLLKISNHLKTCPASFSQSTECLISALTSWTPFRRYWKSAAAAVNYLVCVEIDGKCQAVVDSTNLTELLPRLNELKYMKCLAHSRCSINICCYLSWMSTMKVASSTFLFVLQCILKMAILLWHRGRQR